MLFDAQTRTVAVECDGVQNSADVADPDVRSAFRHLLEGLAFANLPFREESGVIGRRRDLGPRGARILEALSAGLVYPSQLSDALGVGRNLISMDLVRLSKAQMIRSRQSSADGRRSEIVLTALGKQVVETQSEEALRFIMQRLAGHSPGEVLSLAAMLRRIGAKRLDV